MFAFVGNHFPALLGLIVGVSLYDTMLIVDYEDCIMRMEQNPVGVWLLQIDNGGVEIFVRAKLAGTLVVAAILIFMRRYRSRRAVPVTTSIAAWQLGLLAYLTLA